MAEWAQTHSDYDAIHILSHGAAGTLHLGSTSLTNNHLDDPSIQTVLAKIGESLTVDGDLLLYGCNIAADAEGQRFVANLAAVTGADVAASDDFTGSSNLNANWILEERTGDIAATSFGWPIEAYAYLLAAPADQNFDSAGVGDKGSQSYTLNGITYTTNDSLGLNINIVNDGNIASGGDLALGYRSSGVSATIQVSFKTSDGSEFKLNSFVISTGLGDTTVTVKAYRDNQEVASSSVTTASFTTFDVSANSSWENIDEVRMTGADLDIDIDDIDFSPAVLPTPTVTNVTSLTNDGSYTIGNVISIQITFSAPVAVTGTPQLILETGTTDRAADYISGSGTNTLTFNYTVQAGDTSADLNYTSTASLLLNGGTINATGDGTAATLTLPTPGAPGSLAATKSIVIDTTAPGAPSTPDMTSGTDSGTSNTDNLTNDTTPTFTGTAEANSTVTLYDTDGTTQIGSVTADGSGNWSVTTSTLSVGSHTITAKATDVAGNTGIASSGLSITVDTSAPTLNPATSTPADNATDIATDTSPVLVYSENIAFGSSGTIVLYDVTNSSAIETFDVATDQGGNDGQVSISGNTLTVNPTNALVEGTTYAIQIGVGALTDIAGNTISPINDNTTYNFTTVPANTPPVFSSLDGTPTFTEDGSAVVLDSNVTVADVELDALNGSNGDYTGASITIARNGGASSQDVFTNTGLLGSLTESQPFTYNSTTIGTVTTNTGGVLKLTFNASATSAIVDAVLQSISYSNGSDDPPANVTLNWTFHDGEANSTGTNQSTVNITAVNDAPTLSANTSTPMFTEDGTAVTLFSAASSSTVESSQAFKGLTLTVTNVTDTTESLTIDGSTVNLTEGASGTTATNSLSYSVSVAANTATVTLSGGAVSATDMNTLIDTLAYSNSSQNPSTGSTRVVTITSIQDSGGIDTGGVDSTSLNIASTVTVVDNPTTITSATFDWQTGELVLTGTDFSAQGGANNDVDASTLTFSVNGGVNYTLTDTADVEITSPTTAALTLSATDLMHVRGLLNNNGTANSSSADFNLAAADRWLPSAPSEVNITDAINAVTVSNVQTPLITSATYDADTGVLTVTGSNLFKKAGTNNDIDVQKLTFTGQGGGTYTIDSATTDVEITSATHFSMILGGTDKTSVDALLDQIGTLSSGGTSYNLAAAENWLAAADLGATIVDTTTPITVNIAPKIRSATYDASSGTLVVTGTNFQANSSGADVDASKLTLTGEGGVTYTLTDTADVERDSVNQFTLSLSTTDKSALNQILNKNGIASTGGTSFNLDAADDWNTNVTAGDTHDATNSVTVSNVAVPTLTSATYDAGSGVLTINGSGFVKLSGDANDIDVSKLTLTGEGGETYTLTSTSVELTSDTAFNVTLNTADLSGISPIFNKAGTTSTSGTTYNLAGAEDWASGANPAVFVADLTGNGITVSNIPVPAITDATYDTGTGALVVTGSGFLKRDGTANDIVANKFSITGLGGAGAAYTLTDTVNAEITSATRFTLNLSASSLSGFR